MKNFATLCQTVLAGYLIGTGSWVIGLLVIGLLGMLLTEESQPAPEADG